MNEKLKELFDDLDNSIDNLYSYNCIENYGQARESYESLLEYCETNFKEKKEEIKMIKLLKDIWLQKNNIVCTGCTLEVLEELGSEVKVKYNSGSIWLRAGEYQFLVN